MSRENGSILGVANIPTASVASGIWSLNAVALAVKQSIWPSDPFANPDLRLDFDQGTTLDSRITFTRATNGTFFNSSGVLSTASSGVARFDHRLEGGVWVNKGLLIEEQRTNSVQRSEEIENAYWANKQNITVTANQIASPDGTTNADKIVPSNGATSYFFANQSNYVNASASQAWSASCFVKSGGIDNVNFILNARTSADVFVSNCFITVNLTNGSTFGTSVGTFTNTSFSVTDVGNGWYRVIVSGTTPATTARLVLFVGNASSPNTITGDGTKSYYAWGAQLESGAFPTSYIATTSASVTRNADVASMTSTNFSSWYNATEGTVYTSSSGSPDPLRATAFSFNYLWALSDNTVNERLQSGYFYDSGTATRRTLLGVFDNNVQQVDIQQTFTYNPTATNKSASAYKLNDFAFVLDGGTVTTDTSGTLPTVNRLYLGSSLDGTTAFLNGHIAKFYYWNTRKPNSFLQTITG